MSNKIKVLIAFPTKGDCHAKQRDWVYDVLQSPATAYCDFTFKTIEGHPVDSSRNLAVKRAIQMGADYLFMIDADTLISKDVFACLKYMDEFDIKALFFPCPSWVKESSTAAWNFGWYGIDESGDVKMLRAQNKDLNKPLCPHIKDKNGTLKPILQIDRAGTGACLFDVRMLASMKAPWFETRFDEFGVTSISEDLSFCDKLNEFGVEIWLDTNWPCSHFKGGVNLLELVR